MTKLKEYKIITEESGDFQIKASNFEFDNEFYKFYKDLDLIGVVNFSKVVAVLELIDFPKDCDSKCDGSLPHDRVAFLRDLAKLRDKYKTM